MDATAVEYMVQTAHDAGIGQDQLRNFTDAGYVPQPVQFRFHAAARACDLPDGPTMIGMGGARGGSKSHCTLAQVGLDDCRRTPGIKVLFLRSVQKAARESFEDLISRIFQHVPHDYVQTQGRLRFPNGSRIILGGFKDEGDIDAYLGIEYDVIVLEEATLLSERKLDMLRGSLRTSRPDWRPRMYLTTNPGSVGHAWFKARFILPYRSNSEKETRFVPANYKDNAFLNPEYVQYLESLTGPLARAWRDGDWDTFEGQGFPTWDYTRHVVEPYEIPYNWTRVRGIDWGYSKPWCTLWAAIDPDNGRVVVYREAYDIMLTDRQQAERIVQMTPNTEQISISFADPSMWAKKTQDIVTTTADIYAQHQVYLTRADNDRLQGKRKVDRLLANLPDGKPGLQVFRNAYNLIRTLPELVLDDVRPEDVDTTGEDHAYDALRYLLTSIHDKTEPRKQTPSPMLQRAPYKR